MVTSSIVWTHVLLGFSIVNPKPWSSPSGILYTLQIDEKRLFVQVSTHPLIGVRLLWSSLWLDWYFSFLYRSLCVLYVEVERSIIVSVRNVEERYLSLPDMNCVTNVPEEKETVINKSSCGPTRELVGVTSNLTGGLRDLASGGLKVFRHGTKSN